MKNLVLALLLLPSQAFAKLPSQDDSALPPIEPGPLSKVFQEEIVIHATPEIIWQQMMDLESYAEWNPWLLSAEGDMEKGGIVWVDVKLGAITMRAKHVVLLVEPYQRFCWRDAGWNANFTYGQRCRTLTQLDDGSTLYVNETIIDGPLSFLGAWFTGKSLKDGMRAENEALKARAEEFARN